MNQISFNTGANYYHTYKESNIITSESGLITGNSHITGYTKEPIEIGDEMKLPNGVHKVSVIEERRNHAGVFKNPTDKENAFFRVECTFQRMANSK